MYDVLPCRLSSAAYAAIACLAVEYIGLFLGVSLFLRGHNCLYILLHFAGAIVTGLMYTQVSVNAGLRLLVAHNAGLLPTVPTFFVAACHDQVPAVGCTHAWKKHANRLLSVSSS
jgi:hypothetical protein